MIKKTLSGLLFVYSSFSYADLETCHFTDVIEKTSETIFCFENITLGYDESSKLPTYGITLLSPNNKNVKLSSYSDNPTKDLLTPILKYTAEDFHRMGFDFAHLISPKNGSLSENHLKILMSGLNRVPMPALLNRTGVWKQLEDYESEQVVKRGSVLSISGVIKTNSPKMVYGYYKVLLHLNTQSVISFIIPVNSNGSDLEKYISTISCIEKHIQKKLLINHVRYQDVRDDYAFNLNVWTQGNGVFNSSNDVCEIERSENK